MSWGNTWDQSYGPISRGWGDYGADCSQWHIDPSSHHYQNPRTLSEKVRDMSFAVGGNRKTAYEEPIPTSRGEAIAALEYARRQASLDGPQGAVNFFNDAQAELFSQISENNILDILERSLTIYARGFEECGVEPSVMAAAYLQGKVEALGGDGIPQLRVTIWGRPDDVMAEKTEEPSSTPGGGPARTGSEVVTDIERERQRQEEKRRRERWWAENKTKVYIGLGALGLLLIGGGVMAEKKKRARASQSGAY